MPVLLSDEELNALSGITDIQYRLYISGIRRYMDYKTGITGIKRKISYQSLSEETYIEPIKGVKNTGSKSRQQIRRAVKALERAGLISIKSTSENLILKCLLAKTDELQLNQGRHKADTLTDTQADTLKQSQNTVKTDASELAPQESRHTGRHPQNEKADTPPLSDTLHNITLPNAHEFFQLLAQQGYYLNQLHSNKKTLAMVHAWVSAKVTLDEAQIGINHVNAQLGRPPDSPTYYNKPVLQVRDDFNKAQLQAQEITSDAKPNRTPKPNRTKPFETLVERTRRELDESLAQTKERIRRSKH